mgnify:CR=1 FL=1|tara:strand:+ start:218 stop:424 length:207 start_codon:yes stop_codon:yes gene_type:complete
MSEIYPAFVSCGWCEGCKGKAKKEWIVCENCNGWFCEDCKLNGDYSLTELIEHNNYLWCCSGCKEESK